MKTQQGTQADRFIANYQTPRSPAASSASRTQEAVATRAILQPAPPIAAGQSGPSAPGTFGERKK